MSNRLRAFSRSLAVAAVVVGVVAISRGAAAQAPAPSPRTGTWKLNLEKSRFAPDPGPRSQTRKDEHSRDGLTATVEGVLANGSPISYRYAPRFDGKDYPIVGTGVPSGGETIAVKHIDEFTVESTLKKAGVVVLSRIEVVSKDGRVLTITSQGKTVAGQPTSNMTVYDKQ